MEKQAELSRLVNAAQEALKAAERFADANNLSFSWSPFYGGGGYYYGGTTKPNWLDDYGSDDGWSSSSHGC